MKFARFDTALLPNAEMIRSKSLSVLLKPRVVS